MANNHYESVVIINASLDDEQVDAIVKGISDTIKNNNGEITELDLWGRKRLAYPIQKAKSGYYAIFRFTAPAELIAKLERSYRLNENVIRYLTIVLDKKALEYYEKIRNGIIEANEISVLEIENAKTEETADKFAKSSKENDN